LLLTGRYIPGLRFVVNSTLGVERIPYRSFLPWSARGGALLSIYTCLLAVFSLYERRRRMRTPASVEPSEAGDPPRQDDD
jgi:membrane protein DedA with SNARE-associated domain